MPTNRLREALEHVRRALAPPGGGLTDAQLLGRFVADRDEGAFAALVLRHGPMVLGVCRRVLGHEQDAEDAFQATFLALARKAPSLRRRAAVGGWLYEVAYRAAVDAGRARERRRGRERQVRDMPHPQLQPPEPPDWRPVLDRELAGLPEKYRAAVVLCDLEGQPRREAARQLGLAEGTLSSRLATGRRMLAGRLSRRGVALSGGALAAALSEAAASAQVPAALVWSTAKAAAGNLAAPTAAVVLMKGVLRAMFVAKLKVVLGAVLVVAALGAGGVAYRAGGAPASEKAAEPGRDTRYVAPDSEVVFTVNVQQIIKSDVFKKGGAKAVEEAVKKNGKFFEAAGLKPLEDIDSLTISGGGSAKDAKVLLVLRGRYNPDKVKAAAEKAAKDKPDEIKVITEDKTTLYRFKPPEPSGPLPPGVGGFDKPLFGAFADKNTFVLTPSKDATLKALKDVGKKAKLSKELKSALEKFTGKESMTMALVVTDELKKALGKVPQTAMIAPKLQTVTAQLTMTDAVAFNLRVNTEDTDTAKSVLNLINLGVAVAKTFIQGNDEIPAGVGDVLDEVKTSREGKSAVLNLKLTEKMLEKAGKKDKDK
jgi:RNA polymerase sigma factor (sigma-70 family)